MTAAPSALPFHPRPIVVTVTSAILVAAGLLLGVTAGMQWLVLFALGAFGPSVLRELGVLGDLDEHQRGLMLRAGQRAYIVGGLFLCAVIVGRQWGLANLDHDAVPASAVLACLLVTWYLSYLIEYWGPRRASTLVLLTFGVFWGAFVVLSHGGEAMHGGAVGFLVEAAMIAPFFVLAWACRRWPRLAGVLMLAAAVGAFVLFQGWRAFTGEHSSLVVALTFPLPLAACGLALLMEA